MRPKRSLELFAGKSAIVTGGASGIGRAIGELLRHSGADVVLADIDISAVSVATPDVDSGGQHATGSLRPMELDVRDRAAVQRLVDDVAERSGGLDYIFNNAGISIGGPTYPSAVVSLPTVAG